MILTHSIPGFVDFVAYLGTDFLIFKLKLLRNPMQATPNMHHRFVHQLLFIWHCTQGTNKLCEKHHKSNLG